MSLALRGGTSLALGGGMSQRWGGRDVAGPEGHALALAGGMLLAGGRAEA